VGVVKLEIRLATADGVTKTVWRASTDDDQVEAIDDTPELVLGKLATILEMHVVSLKARISEFDSVGAPSSEAEV
jgi:hypothetical protein